MGVYDRAIKTAERMIGKYGQDCTWKQNSNGTPSDPAQPWKPSQSTPVEHPVTIFFTTLDKDTLQTLFYQNGSEIPAGCILAYMASVSFTPSLKDTIVRNGEELRINSIDVFSPQGDAILYKMVLK